MVSPFVPAATIDHAGGAYLYRLLQEWGSRGWSVSLLAPRNEDNERHAPGLPGVDVHLFPSGFQSSRGRKIGNLLAAGAITGTPATWFDRLPLEARRALDEADVIDLQWGESYRLASELRRRFPQTLIEATAHDIVSQAAGRAARGARGWQERILGRLTSWHFQRYERTSFAACDRIYVFNPANAAVIAALGVTTEVLPAPPLTETSPGAAHPAPESRRVLFTGAMWRTENQEGVAWFLDEVWPRVVSLVPDSMVRIAGARPPEWLLARQGPRVEVTGFVEDLLSTYQDVAVVVAPLLRGAGLKFKVAQALVMGFPVVATTVGLEGINESTRPRLFASHDTAADFAGAVVDALTNPPQTRLEDVTLIRNAFDFDTKIAALVTELIELADG